MNIFETQIRLFKDTFRGRDDIYATRWEKENKSGYMPAYFFDPYLYRAHKMKGGTFKDYSGKTHQPLTDDQIKKHISGEQLIGASSDPSISPSIIVKHSEMPVNSEIHLGYAH